MSVVQFTVPTSIVVAGSSGSGKTTFVKKLLENANEMFTEKIDHICYYYNIWQETYEDMEKLMNIDFHQGLPTEIDLKQMDSKTHKIIVLDDLQHAISKSLLCQLLLTQISHHKKVTVIYILQNFYYKNLRDLTLSTHVCVLCRSLRDLQQIRTLARQTQLGQTLVKAYEDCTSVPYGYLVVDMSPHNIEPNYRLRTNIFPDEYTIVYLK